VPDTKPGASLKLSPRVLLHDIGARPLDLSDEWIALPRLPGKIFGDGTHPTTRLCAGAVDLLCRQQIRAAVLDVGTGTGVLARIARARGARFVVGTDIDPEALLSAEAHAALDSHPVDIIVSDAPPNHWGTRFDLVVANILEAPLRELARPLSGALAGDGILLISGFTPLQAPGLGVFFASMGLSYMNRSTLDEWALMMFRR
jgi:ribosomal protein L11 methyltransferase